MNVRAQYYFLPSIKTPFLAQVGDAFVVTGKQGHYTLQLMGDKNT